MVIIAPNSELRDLEPYLLSAPIVQVLGGSWCLLTQLHLYLKALKHPVEMLWGL